MRPQRGRRKLLDSALGLFESQGYFATTVAQITEAAGVSKGLVYNYFSSKDELLVALVDDATARMAAVAEPLSRDVPLEASMAAFVDGFFRFLREERPFLRIQMTLLVTPELREVIAASQQRRAEHLLTTVRQWFGRAGVAQPEHNARVFLALLDGVALHHLHIYDPYPLAALEPLVVRTALTLCADPT